MINNRREEIKKKGFNINMIDDTEDVFSPEAFQGREMVDFSKVKVGAKTLENAILQLGELKKINPHLADKATVHKAIESKDFTLMREISNFFYRNCGIYSRLCRYMAYLYRYDWMVTPYINSDSLSEDRILEKFDKVLNFLDNFEVKRFLGEAALQVMKEGCYYGYIITETNRAAIQELPADYARSRFTVNGRPAVEFNMKFFDQYFKDTEQRMKMLKLFPKEFSKGYVLYKEGKLPPQFAGDTSGWYLLDPEKAIKFNINGEDYPMMISVIPAIIDLDGAQELDRQKMQQRLLKIIIQKMPLDKNGDLIFDVDEAQALHNNAVKMLGKAIGIDVLTTFADVDVADMADNESSTATDDLERVERTVYNEAGISQMQFNTDGNIALEKSILNDEAAMYNLLLQFEGFLNDLIKPYNTSPKKINFRVQLLTTTIYNYKDLSKLYKEQMQVGFSKMLPQIALGQSQSCILANAYFENDILDLVNVFVPPLMSSTMNADSLAAMTGKQIGSSDSSSATGADTESTGGRPEKSDDQKSEKTIQNKESQN